MVSVKLTFEKKRTKHACIYGTFRWTKLRVIIYRPTIIFTLGGGVEAASYVKREKIEILQRKLFLEINSSEIWLCKFVNIVVGLLNPALCKQRLASKPHNHLLN